jgi:uncharacterized protein YbaR (Trm112 family)
MSVSEELVGILVCPKCKGSLALTAAGDGLDCTACNLRYRIEEDIPVLLVDEASPID